MPVGRQIRVIGLLVLSVMAGLLIWQMYRANTLNTSSTSSPYHLSLQSRVSYISHMPVALSFTIRDQSNRVFKNFNTSNKYNLMLTIIRSNRTNFQHIHPIYNEKTGIFTIADFQLPTSGIYRLFAQFTAANTPKNHDGFNSPSTVFTDISVSGDDTVQPRQEASDALTSSADGFSTSIFSASNNIDTPESPPGFTAGRLNILAINITKNGIPFKNLKGYKGSFGRIFAFSPSCELISANSEAEVGDHQTGTLKFKLTFPTAGRYVLFMQTQANNQVTTFSYTIIVKKELTS